jgi:DNA polymerase-1
MSKEINFQNFPSKENKEIRNIISAPEGCYLIAADFAALEVRGLTIASKDKALTDAIWNNTDFHMFWSKRIFEDFPEILNGDENRLNAFRKDVKNILVFPAFYGSSQNSIANDFALRYKPIPQYIMDSVFEDFWETYYGVSSWQKECLSFYNRHGYVENITGRRRHGILKKNEIINFPIQSFCSFDICIVAGNRLAKLSHKLNKPELHFRINVHDELVFVVPEDKVEETVLIVSKEMVRPVYDFINIPLGVEVKVGKQWADLDEVAKFETTDFFNYKGDCKWEEIA